jgi:flavin reductase (NADH)
MSRLPSAVAVVTTLDGENRPRGFTCTSLCSASLDPPLVITCVQNGSRTLAAAKARRSFAVNILHAGGHYAADLFASLIEDKFARVRWRPGPALSLPWLTSDAAVLVECTVVAVHAVGDHHVLVGLAESAVRADGDIPGAPLLYCRRSYGIWPADEDGAGLRKARRGPVARAAAAGAW